MKLPERCNVQSCTITVRPRYCETDQAKVVHHSVYPIWFEMGRTELLRANGVAYKDLEREGVFFVVAELHVKFRRPAYYDDQLSLTTTCSNITSSKVEHTYRLVDPAGKLLAEATTVLACLDKNGTVRRIPEFMYPA